MEALNKGNSSFLRVVEPAGAQDKIILEGLSKRFKTRKRWVVAVEDTTLTIREGEFVCIVGPSGCGKTTLLRILAGLETATEGKMEIRHRDPKKPLNSMVFQEQSIFPWMTVRQNVAYGLKMRRVEPQVRDDIVERYIKIIGLSKFADAFPHQLSGGMKQRVSVARAFANDPEILFMDEPFAALDEQNKILLQEELLRIWEANRKTVVFITHSIDEALVLSDRIVLMTAHPGRIKASYQVELPRPRDIATLRTNPVFHRQFSEIWLSLREEVNKAKANEGLTDH